MNETSSDFAYFPPQKDSPRYDNHLIIVKITKNCEDSKYLCKGENTEKYIFFSLRKEFEKAKQGKIIYNIANY